MSNQSNASGGIGMGGALFLLFLGLKLTGHIDWSWWWVTAPLWAAPALIMSVALVGVTVGLMWRFAAYIGRSVSR